MGLFGPDTKRWFGHAFAVLLLLPACPLTPLRQQQASNLVTTTLTRAARFACLMAGVHNSRPCGGPGDKNVYSYPYYLQYAHRSFFFANQNVYEKDPDVGEVQGSLRNCGSSVQNWAHVTFLASRIWMWCLDLWKACAHTPHCSRRLFVALLCYGPPLWSSGQSFWLQIQRSRVRFPALPDFLSGSVSGTGYTQPREPREVN